MKDLEALGVKREHRHSLPNRYCVAVLGVGYLQCQGLHALKVGFVLLYIWGESAGH